MKSLRGGPLVVSVSALLVMAGVAAVFGGLSRDGSSSDSGVKSISTRSDDGARDECPSGEEIQAYWEKYGRDLKSAGTCGDPDPLPPGDGTGETPLGGPAPPTPTTLAEAQAMLDPDDDPLLLLAHDKTHGWFTVLVALPLDGQKPPPRVRTVEQFASWLHAQNAN